MRQFFFSTIHIGDCLEVASVLPKATYNLIYMDPPFASEKDRVGTRNNLEFSDRWSGKLPEYLAWLRRRIKALMPLLCRGGSMVVHLDYRAVHYAKVMLDEIFGSDGFINEIIWHYTGGGRSKSRFSCKHDNLLWYCGSGKPCFNIDAARVPYKPTSGYAKSGIVSHAGRKYSPNPKGTPIDDVWDIPIVNPMSCERVGYPTQKPLKLLDRIIRVTTNPGDSVLDPFCGSGTTLAAAQAAGREWTGIDLSKAAAECSLERLRRLNATEIELISH